MEAGREEDGGGGGREEGGRRRTEAGRKEDGGGWRPGGRRTEEVEAGKQRMLWTDEETCDIIKFIRNMVILEIQISSDIPILIIVINMLVYRNAIIYMEFPVPITLIQSGQTNKQTHNNRDLII